MNRYKFSKSKHKPRLTTIKDGQTWRSIKHPEYTLVILNKHSMFESTQMWSVLQCKEDSSSFLNLPEHEIRNFNVLDKKAKPYWVKDE